MVKHSLDLDRLFPHVRSSKHIQRIKSAYEHPPLPLIAKTHHTNGGYTTWKHYDELVVGHCCEEVVKLNSEGITVVRWCGERFKILSGGCREHPHQTHNANRFLKDAARGLPAELPVFLPHEHPEYYDKEVGIEFHEFYRAKAEAARVVAKEKKEAAMRRAAEQFQEQLREAQRQETEVRPQDDSPWAVRMRGIEAAGASGAFLSKPKSAYWKLAGTKNEGNGKARAAPTAMKPTGRRWGNLQTAKENKKGQESMRRSGAQKRAVRQAVRTQPAPSVKRDVGKETAKQPTQGNQKSKPVTATATETKGQNGRGKHCELQKGTGKVKKSTRNPTISTKKNVPSKSKAKMGKEQATGAQESGMGISAAATPNAGDPKALNQAVFRWYAPMVPNPVLQGVQEMTQIARNSARSSKRVGSTILQTLLNDKNSTAIKNRNNQE